MSQPHERSSKRSAAEAVQEQQEAGQALLEEGEPADAPGGSKGAPAGPGRPAEAGARLVVRPGAPQAPACCDTVPVWSIERARPPLHNCWPATVYVGCEPARQLPASSSRREARSTCASRSGACTCSSCHFCASIVRLPMRTLSGAVCAAQVACSRSLRAGAPRWRGLPTSSAASRTRCGATWPTCCLMSRRVQCRCVGVPDAEVTCVCPARILCAAHPAQIAPWYHGTLQRPACTPCTMMIACS